MVLLIFILPLQYPSASKGFMGLGGCHLQVSFLTLKLSLSICSKEELFNYVRRNTFFTHKTKMTFFFNYFHFSYCLCWENNIIICSINVIKYFMVYKTVNNIIKIWYGSKLNFCRFVIGVLQGWRSKSLFSVGEISRRTF